MVRETTTLIESVKKMYPVLMFLKNRYFPDGRCFYSEKALVEMKKGGQKDCAFCNSCCRWNCDGERRISNRIP